MALPAGLLVALAIWQTARTAGALVDDVLRIPGGVVWA
ncbi:hypothetical protein EDD38_7344 [Kitasatospora cineracea]|uniref:Uncharacterized protein n=1 Tax=Kitasatospora cineracea TaxID=88074 RepID=A0A3N4RVD4_9ACTN|nr:hypothetical protein EDD38_7344 [Kitasatospora cineracea]